MDTTLWTYLMLWMASGAMFGGVVTPILARSRGVNEWIAAVGGLVIGMVGNLLLLVPLWLVLRRMEPVHYELSPWRYDALSLDEGQQTDARSLSLNDLRRMAVPALASQLWPQPRPDREHSHRMTYVGVFAALAVITAIEVLITATEPFPVVGPLVALSTIKVLLVVLYFMHLRYDNLRYTVAFVAAIPFAAMVLAVLAAVAA